MVRDKSDTGLRMIVTWRVANVATVIISIDPITDVKTCTRYLLHQMRRFRTVVQKLLNKALRSSSIL